LAVTEYSGDGPPLVLVHGIGTRGVSWWPVIDDLAARFQVYALDQRGHGASDKPAAGYLLADYAADLAAVIAALALDRPAVIGHSLGGLVALSWASDHPSGSRALVVEDPALRPRPEILQAFDGWLALAAMPLSEVAAYYRGEHPNWTVNDCRRRAESITATAPAVFAELRADTARRLIDGGDRIAEMATIDVPTLLIHGDAAAGSMAVPEDVARFAAEVPGARTVRVPGAPHDIHRERPTEFLAAVMPFLERVGQ